MHDAVKCQHSSKQNHHKFVTAKGAAPAAVTGTPVVPDKICCPLQCDWGRNEVCQKAAGSRTEMWKLWGCGQRVGMDRKCALIGFVWLRESRHTEEDKSLKPLSHLLGDTQRAQQHLPPAWPVLCAPCADKAEELPRKMCIKLRKQGKSLNIFYVLP